MSEYDNLDPVGRASVFRDRITGQLVLDTESVVAGDDDEDVEDDDTSEEPFISIFTRLEEAGIPWADYHANLPFS